MSRASVALLFVIVLELAAGAFWIRSQRATASLNIPQPDLGILDSASAAVVRTRQDRVLKDGKPESWTDLAAIYVMYGYFREADTCCRRCAAIDPGSIWNNFWWGTTLSRLGVLQESSEKFRAAIPQAKKSQGGVCWYCIGLNCLREEQPQEAEKAFLNATDVAPANYELAKLMVRSGRAQQALPILEKLTQDNPLSVRYWQLRANATEAVGDVTQADDFRERADRAPELHSSDELTGFLEQQIVKQGLDLQIQEGKRLMESRRMTDAVEVLRDALSQEWRPLTADLLAEAELSIGRPTESIRILTEAMNRFSVTPERLIVLGDAWRIEKNLDESVRLWERATRLQVSSRAHSRLADYYAGIGGDPLVATRHRALAAYAEGLDAFRHDRLQQAKEFFANSVELAPDLAQSWFYLGECRRFLNESALAGEAYQRCLDINKYHGRARHALKRLNASLARQGDTATKPGT